MAKLSNSSDPFQAPLRRIGLALRDGDFATAAAVTGELLRAPPADDRQLAQLAQFLFAQDKYEETAGIYRTMLLKHPGEPQLLYNLAAVLRLLGEFEEAEALCDRAISQRPHDHQAQWLRTSLRRQTAAHNHVVELTKIRNQVRNAVARSWIGYALAKELEDLGDYDGAFAAMADAGRTRRSTIRYDVAADEAILSAIAETFAGSTFADASSASAADSPVFIIGLPRTGTTLCERVLSYDGLLHPAGELPDFARQLVRMTQERGAASLTPLDLVRSSRNLDWAELGRRYLSAVRGRLGGDGRFIDKLPLNFLYAGLIHLALPDARIVHLVRDPVDTCLAIYKHPFEALYPFSYDVEELARYHRAYSGLMEHWRNILVARGAMIDIVYEDLARQPETVARRLRAFCGLPWQPACLDLPGHAMPISSASAVQARQPIDTSSIGKSAKYGSHMDEFRRLLSQ